MVEHLQGNGKALDPISSLIILRQDRGREENGESGREEGREGGRKVLPAEGCCETHKEVNFAMYYSALDE